MAYTLADLDAMRIAEGGGLPLAQNPLAIELVECIAYWVAP